MKRFHLLVGAQDIDESVLFYSTLFATQPAMSQRDYAKWLLEGPRINFAISHTPGSIPVYGEDTPVFDQGLSAVLTDQTERNASCVPKQAAASAGTCCVA